MRTEEELKAASKRLEELSKEFVSWRNTTRLIGWLKYSIEDRLLNTGEEEDAKTGIYIALLNAMYRLQQFEGIIKKDSPEDNAIKEILNIARAFGEHKNEPEKLN